LRRTFFPFFPVCAGRFATFSPRSSGIKTSRNGVLTFFAAAFSRRVFFGVYFSLFFLLCSLFSKRVSLRFFPREISPTASKIAENFIDLGRPASYVRLTRRASRFILKFQDGATQSRSRFFA